MKSLRSLLLLLLLASSPAVLAAKDSTDRDAPDETIAASTAGGSLTWVSSKELDLLGDLWADVPLRLGPRSTLFLDLFTRAEVEQTTAELTFLVRDLDYRLAAGWRGSTDWSGGRAVSLYLGEQGKLRVDAPGRAYLRYVGLGLESRGYRLVEEHPFCTAADCVHQNRLAEWSVSGGPVIDQRQVQGDFVLRGDARFWTGPNDSALLSLLRAQITVDGYFDGLDFRADVALGPNLAIPVSGGRQLTLFAHYQFSDNPLGIGTSAVLAGFDYAAGADARPVGLGAPAISGILGAGAGEDGRRAGQLELRFVTPRFARWWYALFDIEADALTAQDATDLYYRYFVGFERFTGPLLLGAYYAHRSNHRVDAPLGTVTSRDVIESGVETGDFHLSGPKEPTGAWGRLDFRLRVGYLVNSAFAEDPRWNLRGGLRWSAPLSPRAQPFLKFDGEVGDVERASYAVGVSFPPAWELQLEYLDDEQLFSLDQTALLLLARYGF